MKEPEYSPARFAPESEAHFQTFVVGLARRLGWKCYHTYDSRHSQGGFPDLIMVRGRRCIAAELKSQAGRMAPDQTEWHAAFDGTFGVEAYVWRPDQKLEIAGILAGPGRVVSILRDLAELMKSVAKYLDAGTAFDRAWAEHLRKDRLDIVNMAQTDRHAHPEAQP